MVIGGLIYGLAVWQNWTTPASVAPWFAPAVSAILVLTGLQLLTSWLLIIVLAELSKREAKVEMDLEGLAPGSDKEETPVIETKVSLAV